MSNSNDNTSLLSSQNRQLLVKGLKFFIVSCGGLVVNTLAFTITSISVPSVFPIYPFILTLLPNFFLAPEKLWGFASVCFAILISTIWNFSINKIWTFNNYTGKKGIEAQTTQYLIVGAIGAIENLVIYGILTLFLFTDPVIAEIVAFILTVLSNFVLNNYWTFKN